jgi:hypothetical protein
MFGTPESIREIEDLTCNWDYSEIVFLSVNTNTLCFSKEITFDSDLFFFAASIFEFIEVGDCIKEYCNPENIKDKSLIVEIHPANYGVIKKSAKTRYTIRT